MDNQINFSCFSPVSVHLEKLVAIKKYSFYLIFFLNLDFTAKYNYTKMPFTS